jgi:hypothetical protein
MVMQNGRTAERQNSKFLPSAGVAIDGLAANTPIIVGVGSTAELIATSPTAMSTVP